MFSSSCWVAAPRRARVRISIVLRRGGRITSRAKRGSDMAITRQFRETVLTRAKVDRRFREAMLTEAINELLAGDLEAGKAMLRDYVNATITFDGLAKELRKPSKSLQR